MKKRKAAELQMEIRKNKSLATRRFVRSLTSILLCASLILSLSSCWSRRELNTLAIVLATALDVGEKSNTVLVTTQIVKPGGLKSGSSSSGDGAQQKAYANISNTNVSILSALAEFTHISNRRMYFSHNRILIFSRELAQAGVSEGLDAFTRNFETRMNVYILISKDKAADILDEEIELEKMPANHIAELLQNQLSNSETPIITLRDFDIATLSGSTAPIAPMIEIYEFKGKKKARLEGTAVFKQDKMIGELNVSQTRGLMWATNKAQKSTITVETKWGKVDLLITHFNSSMTPVFAKDGTVKMNLKVEADCCMESNATSQDMSSVENIEMLSKLVETSISSDIAGAFRQAKKLSADVFGCGEAIRRDYPKEWEKMKKNWDEEFFKIEPVLELQIKMNCTGGMGKPIVPGGAE